MLAQPTEHDELGATIRFGHWYILVARTLQVPVAPRERAERQVVQEAPIRSPVERELRRPRDCTYGGSERSGPAGQEVSEKGW